MRRLHTTSEAKQKSVEATTVRKAKEDCGKTAKTYFQ
jgi:hypothetical protein